MRAYIYSYYIPIKQKCKFLEITIILPELYNILVCYNRLVRVSCRSQSQEGWIVGRRSCPVKKNSCGNKSQNCIARKKRRRPDSSVSGGRGTDPAARSVEDEEQTRQLSQWRTRNRPGSSVSGGRGTDPAARSVEDGEQTRQLGQWRTGNRPGSSVSGGRGTDPAARSVEDEEQTRQLGQWMMGNRPDSSVSGG